MSEYTHSSRHVVVKVTDEPAPLMRSHCVSSKLPPNSSCTRSDRWYGKMQQEDANRRDNESADMRSLQSMLVKSDR